MPVHAVDFNTDILDAEDKQNIDISRFSQAGYIMPGEYQMDIRVNDQGISPSAFLVKFLEPSASGTDGKKLMPQACLTPEVVQRIGLTPASLDKVTYWNNGQCADFSRLPGVEIRPNPAEGMLYINMPQAWLEYSDASWLPPSRWDNGIPGSWRYTGARLESDERMLPPKLRGYAPQISGIANTNARVVVSQQGRVLYDSTVPAGPFTIQDLDSSVRGRLDVEIIEQNGQKKTFQVNTAYVPYLTRPGQVRYKLVSGRSRGYEHTTEGPVFMAGEASWGISNKWSLYGGGIVAGDYNALAVGLGRDLNEFGTVSADVTQSVARIPGEVLRQGKSWRLSYSKRFDDVNADITFAGYRFSERNYMTMQQYLDARYRHDFTGREKEQYDVSLNKGLEDGKTSVGFQYSHQTYWDQRTSNYYTLSLNRYFDISDLKNISVSLSASRSRYQQRNGNEGGTYNDSVYLRLSVPWGNGTLSYNGGMSNDRYTNTVSYNSTLNGGLDNYNLSVGLDSGGGQKTQGQVSGYYGHSSPLANVSASFSAVENGYTSFGMSASGGATITAKGAALHAGGMNGGTRLLVDTDGVGDNSHPPFGASVTNAKGRELGMVADSGLAWLSGVSPGETLNVGWDGKTQCVVDIPKKTDPAQQLLLPCRKAN
ncbi:fimbrial usher protein [Cooperia oncophora]